ncbi:hypothetical protein SAMN04487895_10778 [Paenibacillus sophorae]|uniref:Uncharacterized protein n=1 Tax=Paenibacillus sophorae TaxID=1333845 RepID=A0A1H8P7I7_9BACL|nr:hypothetical protein SAMN04487895_10778 [Paenibacillus sophorae]
MACITLNMSIQQTQYHGGTGFVIYIIGMTSPPTACELQPVK